MNAPTTELVEALRWALGQVEDCLDPEQQAALEAAKATLARHAGPTFVENPPDPVYLALILAGRMADAFDYVEKREKRIAALPTPGPWRIVEDRATAYILPQLGNDDTCITSVSLKGNGQNYSKNMANAKLIAAAPEMLEALEATLAEFMHYRPQGGTHPMLGGKRADEVEAQAKAAIAKARGGTQP